MMSTAAAFVLLKQKLSLRPGVFPPGHCFVLFFQKIPPQDTFIPPGRLLRSDEKNIPPPGGKHGDLRYYVRTALYNIHVVGVFPRLVVILVWTGAPTLNT